MNITNNRTIIIIGGMGPQASLELHRRILVASRAHHDGSPDKFPNIIHMSLQIPEFFSSSSNEDAAISRINEAISRIVVPKDALICMPCNTAHKLVGRTNIPSSNFVSMVELVADRLVSLGVERVGVLASPNTISSRFFDSLLAPRNVGIVYPTESDSNVLDDLISNVISGRPVGGLMKRLSGVANNLILSGADSLLLGCTELPLIGLDSDLPTVDCLDVLVDELVGQYYCYNRSNHE
ncbi:MAG: amino acid racemase [Candidatus Saccharimonadales bacterium]